MNKKINLEIPLDLIIDQISEDVRNSVLQKLSQPSNQEDSGQLLTRIETSRKLKVSLPTLLKYTRMGLIRVHYLGSSPRYKLSDIEKALKELPVVKFKHQI